MPSTVESPVADLPQSFEAWWSVPGNWVEEPNQRRGGWSGMLRATLGGRLYYVKKQCNHLHRSLASPRGEPTTEREYRNILRLESLGIRVPHPVFRGSGRTADGYAGILVTEALEGFVSLDTLEADAVADRRLLAEKVGAVIGILHRAQLQHSCLYDKHIMVRGQGAQVEVALIDLEKLRRPMLPWRAAAHDLDQLSRHQSLWDDGDWRALLAAHALALRGSGKPA